ncbi:GtrA family protein [Pantoea septica]|uniref:GtrA family protein n=1 Tax=Pantoea septica TaxID=472695 RepID=UPI00289CCB37|nr:GtrA family protein [Pantoea septica]
MTIAIFKNQAVKYAIVGLVNTGITAVVIFACMHAGMGVYNANAAGYLCGIAFSFLANSVFTFSSKVTFGRLAKFLLSCFICWSINALAIKAFLAFYPNELYVSQFIGMFIYTLAGFLINKLWVMK